MTEVLALIAAIVTIAAALITIISTKKRKKKDVSPPIITTQIVQQKNEIGNVTVTTTFEKDKAYPKIYNDTTRWIPFLSKKRRFQCLANEYTNVTSTALRIIMQKYVQQKIKHLYIDRSPELQSNYSLVKDLLRCLKNNSILLIGKAGYGKSTALRWLFLKSHDRCAYVRMCNLNPYSPDMILSKLKQMLMYKQVVFLDGIDESTACISSNSNFIKELTDWLFENEIRFIISTRADHFNGINNLLSCYFSSDTIKRRGGLAIFEMEGFQLKQFIQATMILKLLQKKDPINFGKKYPAEKVTKENKRTLKKAFQKSSIFQAPIFSRYAFILIDAAQDGLTLEKAIEAIIKWECHDYLQKITLKQKSKVFDFYKKIIYEYLENIAHKMMDAETLEINDYKPLIERYIKTPVGTFLKSNSTNNDDLYRKCIAMIDNAAFCLLNVSEQGEKISFEHSVFKDFFLAKKLANTNLRSNKECRELFYLLSKSKTFIESYVEQLITNGKFDLIHQLIKPRRTYSSTNLSRDKFIEDIFNYFTDDKGVQLLPGADLTLLAELFPNVRVNCLADKKISPVCLEILELRQRGFLVEPVFPVDCTKEITLAFCQKNQTIPQTDLPIVQAAHQLCKELPFANDIEAINYIALIYAQRMRYEDIYCSNDNVYSLMSELSHFFGKHPCETSRYFCYWYSEVLHFPKSFYNDSIDWAKNAIRNFDNVPLLRDLEIKIYRQILRSSIRLKNWSEFDMYFNLLHVMGEKIDFNLMQYRIKSYMEKGENETALEMLYEYESNANEDYQFIYLKGTCMNRLQSWSDFDMLVSKLESLAESEKGVERKNMLNCMRTDLLVSYYFLTHNPVQLLQIAKEGIKYYTERKSNSGVIRLSKLVDALEGGNPFHPAEPGLWV